MAGAKMKLGVQLLVWSISAGFNLFLLPFFAVFWMWSYVTGYARKLVPKDSRKSIGSDRVLREFGTHRYIQLKDVSIHYVEAGDRRRPLMLCLHGFPEFWYSWRHQIKEFSSTHWVVAVDLRGYGQSDRPNGRAAYCMDQLVKDVRGIIEKLGRPKCDVLLTHDWGGAIAWSLCSRHPHLVERLVVMNCPHPAAFLPVVRSDYTQILKSWYMIFFQLPLVPETLLTLFRGAVAQIIFQLHRDTLERDEAKIYLDMFRRPGDLTGPMNYYRNIVDDVLLKSAKDEDLRVRVPTLLVWGLEDRYLNRALAQETAKWADEISIEYVEGATHWVQQDAPEIVNQKIRHFLSTQPAN